MPEVNDGMLESNGVPVASRRQIGPSCTCYISSGTDPGQGNIPSKGHRSDKKDPRCALHFPTTSTFNNVVGGVAGAELDPGEGIDWMPRP